MADLKAPLWSSAAASEEAAIEEQEILGTTWTFVGFLGDIVNNNDWITATLGGRSIFIQKFGDEIRGFENRCAHRSFPLRTGPRGNGHVVCGFHHWRYDKEGLALGIPMCQDFFGTTPRALNARLKTVDISLCGSLIFGRFLPSGGGPSLEDFLGDAFTILKAFCPIGVKANHMERTMAANWKFSHHISLDDYHIVAIHPTTFGKNGYLKNENLQYARIGPHSVFIASFEPNPLPAMIKACADGTFQPECYVTINLFPNLVISLGHVGGILGVDYWNVTVIRFVPKTHNTSTLLAWTFPAPFPVKMSRKGRWTYPIVSRLLPIAVLKGVKKITNEDAAACEKLQLIADQMTDEQLLSTQERRIGWFEEAYANAMIEGRRRRRENSGKHLAVGSSSEIGSGVHNA